MKLAIAGLAVGIAGVSFPAYDYVKARYFPRSVFINLHKDRVHLGDNVFAVIGGESVPRVADPYRNDVKSSFLMRYDKETDAFLSDFGLPSFAHRIASHYLPLFMERNLKAWKHIRAVERGSHPPDSYIGETVSFGVTTLAWEKNQGNYYQQHASVALIYSGNMYSKLQELGIDPNQYTVSGAKLWFSTMHGGKRPNQPEAIELYANGSPYPITLGTRETRHEERVSTNIKADDLPVGQTTNTTLAIVVLPYNEQFPIPPGNSGYPSIGPAHFRDLEVWNVDLELILKPI